jgi:hypothetical protein
MSPNLLTASELASEDWQIAEADTARPLSLVVQLRRRAHVLPYPRLVFAEGDNSRVVIAFASHLVTVNGHNLAALLAALADQRVIRIIEPTDNESKFGVRGDSSTRVTGPSITDISVEQPQ